MIFSRKSIKFPFPGSFSDESAIKEHIDEVVSHGKVVHARINTIYTQHELHQIA